ncbi:MAG: hypothetical protein AB7F19_03750 [Candidatus Babeliales bacterium]
MQKLFLVVAIAITNALQGQSSQMPMLSKYNIELSEQATCQGNFDNECNQLLQDYIKAWQVLAECLKKEENCASSFEVMQRIRTRIRDNLQAGFATGISRELDNAEFNKQWQERLKENVAMVEKDMNQDQPSGLQ